MSGEVEPDKAAPLSDVSQPGSTSDFWLRPLRYGVSVTVGSLCVALPVLPGLNGIVAPALIPLAVIFALIVALPVALVVRATGRRGVLVAACSGALLGLIPGAIVAFSGEMLGVVLLTAYGAAGGLASWLALKLQTLPTMLVAPRHRTLTALVSTFAIVLLTGAGALQALAVIAGPKDLTCHNVFRNGGQSLTVSLTAKLRMSSRDWPRLRAVLQEAAAADGWSMRDHSKAQTLGGSLCQEAGTQVTFQQWTRNSPPDTEVTLRVVAPQGGDAWKPAVDLLLDRLESEWPGALRIEPALAKAKPPPAAAS